MTPIRWWTLAGFLVGMITVPAAWAADGPQTCPPSNNAAQPACGPIFKCELSCGTASGVQQRTEGCCDAKCSGYFCCPLLPCCDLSFVLDLAPECLGLPPLPWSLLVEFAMPPSREERIEKLMKRYHVLYKQGKYEEAVKVALKALEIDPNCSMVEAAVYTAKMQARTAVAGTSTGCREETFWIDHLDDGEACSAPDAGCPEHMTEHIERLLLKPISFDFQGRPLSQVIDDLRVMTGINIIVDTPDLVDEGLNLETPVTIKLEGVSLKSALTFLLHQVHLAYVIDDEALRVTTQRCARYQLVTRTYPIRDLAFVPDNTVPMPPGTQEAAVIADSVMHVITSTIAPESWSLVGGRGTIDYFTGGQCLVINQPADVQEQVAELLAALRRTQAKLKATTQNGVSSGYSQCSHCVQTGCPASCGESGVTPAYSSCGTSCSTSCGEGGHNPACSSGNKCGARCAAPSCDESVSQPACPLCGKCAATCASGCCAGCGKAASSMTADAGKCCQSKADAGDKCCGTKAAVAPVKVVVRPVIVVVPVGNPAGFASFMPGFGQTGFTCNVVGTGACHPQGSPTCVFVPNPMGMGPMAPCPENVGGPVPPPPPMNPLCPPMPGQPMMPPMVAPLCPPPLPGMPMLPGAAAPPCHALPFPAPCLANPPPPPPGCGADVPVMYQLEQMVNQNAAATACVINTPSPTAGCCTLHHGQEHLQITGPCLEGSCDCVTLAAHNGAYFEGHVRLTHNLDGQHAEVVAERGCVSLQGGQIQLGATNPGFVCIPAGWRCEGYTGPAPGSWVLKNGSSGIEVSGLGVHGTCESVTVSEQDPAILLEGHVRLKYQDDDQHAQLSAERIRISLRDGAIQLNVKGPQSSPLPYAATAPDYTMPCSGSSYEYGPPANWVPVTPERIGPPQPLNGN